ncbi:hypothetical protein [Nonomuraea sp. NPDC046570]|uniref:hypothetical protein n=1 Tax=Nonomuraea sp. NPDC046570 TaxID=3155255 RepID=UPI0033E8B693
MPHPEDGLTTALLQALSGEVPPPFAVRRYHPLPQVGAGERGFTVDQTNRSIVVGERVVVKWLTPPVPMPHPTPAAFAHLTEVGFADTAPPYAAITRWEGAEELLVALVTGFLPGARDGWEWCVDEAEAGRTAFAADLGRLAADLHLALATFPDPAPEAHPAEGLDTTAAATRAERALAEAMALTGGADGAWLASREDAMRAELAPLAGPVESELIRIHGDLHVGQILQWRDGYAVIDFDGNPTIAEAAPYQPAARDVAQLTTSLEHVAQVAVKRRGTAPADAARWARESRAAMLAAYTTRLSERGRPELLDAALIRPFEVEQECRELIYAARHLPRWRYAPMGVLRTWYPDPEETP